MELIDTLQQKCYGWISRADENNIRLQYRRTFHSDQGWAYQMKVYSHRLKEEKNLTKYVSVERNCNNNSVMENFFGLLKQRDLLWRYLL